MSPPGTSSSGASDFKIGAWWVRPRRNELERADESVHVEARSMEVLVCLCRHAPAVVSKERLLDEVWGDRFVGDDVISHAVWELRKALGDSARDPTYIQTVPRKGYRVVAEILRPQGAALPMEGVRIDDYDLRREIGRGAMGVVFEAVDRRLGRTVAIKFLAGELTRDPEARRRFEREARLAASLDHPNLAPVHRIGETAEGHPYLVSPCYAGGSLKDRLAAGPVAVAQAVDWVRQLLAGLGAAHQRDVVHRDVKPANLLLDEHGTLKICDFGIAKLLGATDLTRTGAALGTPAYKSPEQALGLPVDHRTDLWAAGVVLYELLTGRRPFDGDEHGVVHAILHRDPRSLDAADGRPVPEALRQVVVKALAKERDERFQSAEEMAAALAGLEDAPAPVAAGGRRRWRRRAAVAAAALGLFLASWMLIPRPEDAATRGSSSPPAAAGGDAAVDAGLDHLATGRRLWLRGNHPANLAKVREHFETTVALLPASTEAKAHLAVLRAQRYALHKELADREAARELTRGISAPDPGSALARTAEAWLLVMDGEVERGEPLARSAVAARPSCGRDEICDFAYLVSAEAAWIGGRAEEAFSLLERGTRVGGGAVRCRLKLAQLYEKSGQRRRAEEAYRQVLDLDPMQSTALLELGNLYLKWKRPEEAIELLRPAYELTGDPNQLVGIGYALYLRELWDEAIATYREAHRVYRANDALVPTPLTAIGDILLEQGRKAEAQKHYRRALEIFDVMENPGAWRRAQRAVCLAKLDRLSEAEAEIQQLLAEERVDDFPDLLMYAARIYALMGDRETLFDLARQWAERGGQPSRLLDDDPAFIPYRDDREYIRILQPGLLPAAP